MKFSKIAPFAMTALLIGGAVVAAEDKAAVEVAEENVAQPVFIKATGTVEGVEKRNNVTYYQIKNENNPHFLVVSEETLAFDNTGKKVELKKGDEVTAYTYANKPMILIYPPQYSPEVVIVQTEETGTAAVGTFDDQLVDEDLSLKLTIGEKTAVVDGAGDAMKAEAIAGNNAVVFYTTSTKSIPAQTTPSKVVLLPSADAPVLTDDEVLNEIIGKDYQDVNGTKMVPLRIIAEELGYKVSSTGKGAILTKGALSYTITRGEKAYSDNKALHQFTEAPTLLEKNKTYVTFEFALELLKNK